MDQDKDIFMMSVKEIKRYQVIRKVLEQQISQQEASEYLGLTDRQIRRIVKHVRLNGESGVIHKLRGKVGNRKLKISFKQKVIELYGKNYWDFGPVLASEKILERDGIKVNDETLRLWLIKEGLWQLKKQKDPKDRTRRQRREHFGQMVQMDGSHHDWLEGLGIEIIFAHSPQAKGRVERVFKTLQDRLVKELRLDQVNTLDEANYLLKSYLPIFNKRFEVIARGSGNFHRAMDTSIDIDEILCVQTDRFLRNDRTIVHKSQWYQILTKTRAQKIMVYEYLNGQIAIKYGKSNLSFKKIEAPAAKAYQPVIGRIKVRGIHVPVKKHPWRNAFKIPEVRLTKIGHF